MSNITLNIVEPASPTPINPVDPSTGTAVPNTGLFTSGIGGAEAAVIATIALVVLAIVGAIIYRKKKVGKGNTPSLLTKCKQAVKSKKHASGLAALALLVSIGTVAGLVKLTTSAIEGDTTENAEDYSSALTVDVSSTELTIELADEPVFAVLPVELTVAEATEAGYTLTAYAEDTNLVSTTSPSNIIPMVVADEGELTSLTDNAYGLSLLEPDSETDEVYTALSTDSSNPTIIRSMPEYAPTEENDTTTIYYGFYITPDIPYGTYTSSDIYYDATINTTLVTFNGNGLYFNQDASQTVNEVEYINVPVEESEGTINQIISGEYLEPAQSLPYIFLGWSEDDSATTPTYTSAEDLSQNLPILPNQPIILYAIWQKATTITFDANDGTGDKTTQTIIAGESNNLYENTFTREGYTFTGWNTEAEPTEQEPGKAYADQAEYTAPVISQNITLYAQWKALPVIGDLTYMQDFATLTEEDKSSVLNSMTQEQQYQLEDSRDHKVYYISRLKDDNIWMTQNLDFNIVNGGAGLDSTNTDVPEDWADAGNLTNTYTTGTTTWNGSTTAPESYDPDNIYWNGVINCPDGKISNCTTTSGNPHYHLGNYYNWTAAIAMSDSSSYGDEQYDVDLNQSICPAGWMLPKSGDILTGPGSFRYLLTQYNWDDFSYMMDNPYNWESPLYFPLSGFKYEDASSIGFSSYYWSSINYSSSFARALSSQFDGSVSPESVRGRNFGENIRCLAR